MSIGKKISDFLSSDKGRQYTDRAKRLAQDPKNQDKARRLIEKLRGKPGR